MAATGGEMAGTLGRILAVGLMHKSVKAALPPDPDRRLQTPLFELEMPWPWDVVTPDEFGLEADDQLVAMAAAPRTDSQLACLRVWSHPLTWTVQSVKAKAVLREITLANNGRNEHLERVTVAGVPGLLVTMTTLQQEVLAVLNLPYPPRDALVEACFQLPATAPGYRHHIDTMLASWRWR